MVAADFGVVLLSFSMSRRKPDPVSSTAAAEPTSRLALWARARRLAANLVAIAGALGRGAGVAAASKGLGLPAMADVDVVGAWRLLERGLLWARALRVRFDREVKAERATGDTDPPERLDDEHENLLPRAASRPRRKSTRGVIAGIPTAGVIGQICDDLIMGAMLIRDEKTARKVQAIREMLQALMEAAEAEAAPPAPAAAAAPATRTGTAPSGFPTTDTPQTVPPDAATGSKPPDSG
jgi:hypothetical protein